MNRSLEVKKTSKKKEKTGFEITTELMRFHS